MRYMARNSSKCSLSFLFKHDHRDWISQFLSRQDKITQKRIINAINILPKGDVKKLQGKSGYRLRVGDFRIIFDKDGNVICIIEIDNRGQIYK